ncbi:MAG TPA: polysaccharide biosynthesis/export family protein [Pontiellaceae bacterium]|nr:polysaccharide biosynthesis/export family protein [Pontiellaceae bacterium]HPR82783.1 polysaccharide biosynthesis/export family protein [Pontiellaceae bacterium]
MRNKPVITAILLLLAGLTRAAEESAAPVSTDSPITATQKRSKFAPEYFVPHSPEDRKLQVGDEVEIGVFGQRDTIAENVPVAPDGKLYYMFLPGVPAEGRTAQEVAKEMESKLGRLFNNPEVSIIPTRFISNRFAIFGKVESSGIYPLDTPTTVRQSIAKAQGIALGKYHDSWIPIHNYKDSWLLRGQEKIPVNFAALMDKDDFSEDIYVRPGDVLYIASALGREIYLMGEVNQPQSQPFTAGLTLTQLISGLDAGAGGYKQDTADIKRVVILRDAMNDPKVFKVNLDAIMRGKEHNVFLEAGDIVFVPEKSFLFTRTLVKAMVSTFVNTFASEFASDLNRKYLFPGGFTTPRVTTP